MARKPDILSHLQELTEENFKEFRYRLCSLAFDDKSPVCRSKLDKAGCVDVAALLREHYGEERAVDAAIETFNMINRRDLAGKLQAEKDGALGPDQTHGRRAAGYREKYTVHVQDKYGVIKDRNSLLGENVILDSRYTKLIIVKETRARKERQHEIMASGQRHAEIMSEQKRSITIGDLFAADEKGKTPRIAVLLGAAGIGKTLTAKKIMFDWAAGKLYNEKFDYVFYINCREVNFDTEQGSVADLMLRNCPDRHALIEAMLGNPETLLFIIDGFDELRLSLDQPEESLCSDPQEKKPMEIVLSSLVRKKVLEKCSLLITTRPAAVEELGQCLNNERYAEILGFSETERREYFDKYFGDKGKARKALNFVKANEMLFTMCFVPIVCWIVCSVIKQQMDEGEELAQTSTTVTGVYLLYLYNLLRDPRSKSKQLLQTNLKGLCSLAADGVCRQKILFEAEELKKHGLDTSDSLFLNENLFHKSTDCECLYSFIHLSFQEFFAALFYALEEEAAAVDKGSGNDIKALAALLAHYGKPRNHLMLTVRFLFGLLNEERMKDIEKKLSCKMSLKIKPELLKWIKTKPQRPWDLHGQRSGFSSPAEELDQLEEFHCVYEIQEEKFVQSALSHITSVKLSFHTFTQMDQEALAFCVRNWHQLESLLLEACQFRCEGLNEDVSRSQKQPPLDEETHSSIYLLCRALKDPRCNVKKLRLWRCRLTPTCCGDLAAALRTSPSLTELDLSGNEDLGAGGVRLLCEGLRHPSCKLQTLGLWRCHLTPACCGDLAAALSTSPSLTELDLGGNEGLGAGSVRLLCKGLRHPSCKLQTLRFQHCNLTPACCGDLAAALSTSPSLTELDMRDNSGLGAGGVRLLCEGLRHPSCKVQTLWLQRCNLTPACCGDLAAALSTSPSLTELHLGGNRDLGAGGVRLLCKGLRHPSCKLQTLRMGWCRLTAACCGDLAAALSTSPSLKELDMRDNSGLGAGGVRLLCEGLRHPSCKLQTLRLSLCKRNAETKQELEDVKGMKPGLVIEVLEVD
ncbi:NACHT, LRR and PYD domains-containing protein 12-like [Alligator mississippiensis]|uniref:NACHT, LRR and PYD domains-containing protein 12-like n=1 Tax=Alligator mississippiensis TaxID=8496 RepID=UPI0028775243|nr:NACHT, LRR and PYD domains-containing protein 12-like [Alligator mississippiensis]XP_059574345.1 NACHT, LRR and PYD domains-containing protein 12-like [Alligator mississippiensis]XP_059574346.1 NACHT, LRR and PYD domains-containing protein 12-like [Alligator mississippiensis]